MPISGAQASLTNSMTAECMQALLHLIARAFRQLPGAQITVSVEKACARISILISDFSVPSLTMLGTSIPCPPAALGA
jgi:hypothetical protein